MSTRAQIIVCRVLTGFAAFSDDDEPRCGQASRVIFTGDTSSFRCPSCKTYIDLDGLPLKGVKGLLYKSKAIEDEDTDEGPPEDSTDHEVYIDSDGVVWRNDPLEDGPEWVADAD